MDFTYEDTYAPYERIATESGGGHGSAVLADSTGGHAILAGLTVAAPRQLSPDSGPGPLAGVVAGFLGAAVAFGVANLTAAFVRPQASPITVLGGALDHLAVEKFGQNDKNLLVFGVYFTIALLAMTIGVIAWRRVWVGVLGMGLLGLVGAFIAVTRPGSHTTDALPPIVGGIAAIVAIVGLIRVGTQWVSYETPGYETPGYESPSYESPSYESPSYESAAQEAPGYDTPAFGTPAYETVSFGTPGYETPGYETAGYETRGYETAGYETPGYETRGNETPGYEFPAYETPAYESATYRTTGWAS
jgi:hypothetical protein